MRLFRKILNVGKGSDDSELDRLKRGVELPLKNLFTDEEDLEDGGNCDDVEEVGAKVKLT